MRTFGVYYESILIPSTVLAVVGDDVGPAHGISITYIPTVWTTPNHGKSCGDVSRAEAVVDIDDDTPAAQLLSMVKESRDAPEARA